MSVKDEDFLPQLARGELAHALEWCGGGARKSQCCCSPTPLRAACSLALPLVPCAALALGLDAEPEQGTELLASAPLRPALGRASRMMMALDGDDGFHGGPTGGTPTRWSVRPGSGPWPTAHGARGRRLARASLRLPDRSRAGIAITTYEVLSRHCHDSLRCFGRARIIINLRPPIQ